MQRHCRNCKLFEKVNVAFDESITLETGRCTKDNFYVQNHYKFSGVDERCTRYQVVVDNIKHDYGVSIPLQNTKRKDLLLVS